MNRKSDLKSDSLPCNVAATVALSKDPNWGDGGLAVTFDSDGSTRSISANNPVQRFCSGKLTVMSPLLSIPRKQIQSITVNLARRKSISKHLPITTPTLR
jgi:hypothetical protein